MGRIDLTLRGVLEVELGYELSVPTMFLDGAGQWVKSRVDVLLR
jgi:hypothetical protein